MLLNRYLVSVVIVGVSSMSHRYSDRMRWHGDFRTHATSSRRWRRLLWPVAQSNEFLRVQLYFLFLSQRMRCLPGQKLAPVGIVLDHRGSIVDEYQVVTIFSELQSHMGVQVSSTAILNDFCSHRFFSFLGPTPANVTIPLYATINITVRVRLFVLLGGCSMINHLCRIKTLSILQLLSLMVVRQKESRSDNANKLIAQSPNQALRRLPIHRQKPDQSSVLWLHASQPWLSPELCYSGSTGSVEEL